MIVIYNDWVKVILNECDIIVCELIFVKVTGMLFVFVGCLCKMVMGDDFFNVFMVGD